LTPSWTLGPVGRDQAARTCQPVHATPRPTAHQPVEVVDADLVCEFHQFLAAPQG
jgi:hypothetical protein